MAKDKNKPKEEIAKEEIAKEVIETAEINKINDSNNGVSVMSKDEFNDRVKDAIIKHKPEHITEESTDEEIATAQKRFAHDIGRQISNHFPDMPTGQVVSLLGLMFNGQYQNDEMLKVIEEMPVGGYGY